MRMAWRKTLGLGAALALAGSAAEAGSNEHAVLVLHVAPGQAPVSCALPGDPCPDVCTTAPLGGSMVYLMVANTSPTSGVAGVQVGLDYDARPLSGLDVEAWFPCTDFAYPDPSWPEAGSGAMFLQDSGPECRPQRSPRLLAVFHLRAHDPDRMALVAHPGRGTVAVVGCDGEEDTLSGNLPSPLGVLDFGGGRGYNPCSLMVPMDPSTWGSIESLFTRS